MKYVSIDLETTGLDPETCQIIEFGAVVDDLSNPKPINQLPTFHAYICQNNYIGEPYALSMHPKIFRRIAEREQGYLYVSPEKLGYVFKEFLIGIGFEEKYDKVTITAAGKNFASFDNLFLRKYSSFSKHVQIRNRVIDPSVLYMTVLDEKLPSLEECKKRAKQAITAVSHEALTDAFDVVSLIRYKFI